MNNVEKRGIKRDSRKDADKEKNEKVH